ncbi:selenium-dependent molybdenum cofactor biosynthesis protein YqeB [soil metagenome]
MSSIRKRVLVRGIGDIGSAVAHKLFTSGYHVVIHDSPRPEYPRRGMAFIDAAFDGFACLDGVAARRITDPAAIDTVLQTRDAVLVYTGNYNLLLSALRPEILIDARMRFRDQPESQKDRAHFVIGVGPGFVAGEHVDCAVETAVGEAGRVVVSGATRSGETEPWGIASSSRFIHAPKAGVFSTVFDVGDHVNAGELVANVDMVELRSQMSGVLSGLTYNGVSVKERARVIEVDPRDEPRLAHGLGERPRRVADGVLEAITRLAG